MNKKHLKASRVKRHLRIRGKVTGTVTKPRLCVFRSINHMYGSLIDDENSKTLLTVSSSSVAAKEEFKAKHGMEIAYTIGEQLAQKAIAANYKEVVFDRAGYRYHGRVEALAEGARKGGLVF